MTVLQVCAYAAPYEGNFIKSLITLSKEMNKNKIKTVFVFPENAENKEWVKNLKKEYDVYFLPVSQARIKYKTYFELKKIYKKYSDLAIIHTHFELYDIPVFLTAPKSVKIFWHLHDNIQNSKSLKNKFFHKLQYGLLNKRTTLLAVSEKPKNYVVNIGYPKSQAKIITNGLDIGRIKYVTTEISERKYDFLLFGWIFDVKGVDLCIDALLKIKEKYNAAIVGFENIKKQIDEKYGCLSNINVIEPTNNVNELFAQSKCFLNLSRTEGLNYATLEATYAGLPVICSDVSDNKIPEIFPTMTMVKSEDVDAIAFAMENQIKNNFKVTDYNLSKEIIENKYSIDIWVKKIINEYKISY